MLKVPPLIVEALSNLRATPIRFMIVLFALVSCLSAPGFVGARYSSNAWEAQRNAILHGAYIYLIESKDPSLDGGRVGVGGEECESIAQLSGIINAGGFASVDGVPVDSHPNGGIEMVDATRGALAILDPKSAEATARVGDVAAKELGLRDGGYTSIKGERLRVARLPDTVGRTDYFARSMILESEPAAVRGKCLVESDMKDLEYVDGLVQATAGERKWKVSKYSEYNEYRAEDVLSARSGMPLVGICVGAFAVVFVLFMVIRKSIYVVYYLSGAGRSTVAGIFVAEFYVLFLISMPSALTATCIGGRMDSRDVVYGLRDQAFGLCSIFLVSVIVVYASIGSPSKVFEMMRKAE